MHDIETTNVFLAVRDHTSTTHVTSTSNHHNVSGVEVNEFGDFALLKVKLESVVNLDGRVRIADGATVVSDDMGDTLGAESDLADFEELVGGFLGGDAVDGETTLDIVKETEVLAGLFDGNGVHEAGGEGSVSSHFAIDLDQSLFDDRGDFTAVQCILQPVAKEDGEGERFTELVGARRRTGSVGTAQLVQHP